jgi:hypothetical protein
MSEEHVVNLLRIGNDNLPVIEYRYERQEIRKVNSSKNSHDL